MTTEEACAADVQKRFPDAGDSRYIVVSVSDTGSGMDKRTMSRVFEPFFTTKEKGKGTGLGLSVVYGIVESHHGYIHVKSEPGVGTTFTLYFPLVSRRSGEITATNAREEPVAGGNETILVVEDEEMLRTLLQSLLKANGYDVLTADNGEKAVEIYRRHQQEIALVVTDIGLPKMGGEEAFRKMRDIDPSLKGLIVSGYLDPQAKAALLAAGAIGVIHKPYAPLEILKQIREAIG